MAKRTIETKHPQRRDAPLQLVSLLGAIDGDGAPPEVLVVQAVNRALDGGLLLERHEPEPAAALRLAIHHHFGKHHLAELREPLAKAAVVRLPVARESRVMGWGVL